MEGDGDLTEVVTVGPLSEDKWELLGYIPTSSSTPHTAGDGGGDEFASNACFSLPTCLDRFRPIVGRLIAQFRSGIV